MQPASQVDILIWRSVLRSSRSSEYIKPIKPPRHPVPYKMSSNCRLYSSLSLLFASHSMKMYYTHTHTRTHQAAIPAATALHAVPTKVSQVTGTFSKTIWRWLKLQVPAIICVSLKCLCRRDPAQQHWRDQHLLLGFKPVPGLTDFSGTRLPGCFFPVEEAAWC